MDVEGLLTTEQRRDIIDEARQIFRHSTLLVEELDAIVAALPKEPNAPPTDLPWSKLLFKHILPIGLADLFYALLNWISSSSWYAQITVRGHGGHGEHHEKLE